MPVDEERAALNRHEANPLTPKRGIVGQRHWQAGWEEGVRYVFERLQDDTVERVHGDVQAILEVRYSGKGKKRPKQLTRRHPVLPALVRRFSE